MLIKLLRRGSAANPRQDQIFGRKLVRVHTHTHTHTHTHDRSLVSQRLAYRNIFPTPPASKSQS